MVVVALDNPRPLHAHLKELRQRLIHILLTLAIFTTLSFTFYATVLKVFLYPLGRDSSQLAYISPGEAFATTFKVCLFSGFILSLPIVLYEVWAFISPALYPRERRLILIFFPVSLFLLLSGMVFGFLVLGPMMLRFLLHFASDFFTPMVTTTSYFSFIFWLTLNTGIIFLLPVFSYVLTRAGILTPAFYAQYWRLMVVLVFVVAAVLTPSPDIYSQLVLATPLLALLLASYIISLTARPHKGKVN
jgi:sec-independent protein translocase protein TatC